MWKRELVEIIQAVPTRPQAQNQETDEIAGNEMLRQKVPDPVEPEAGHYRDRVVDRRTIPRHG